MSRMPAFIVAAAAAVLCCSVFGEPEYAFRERMAVLLVAHLPAVVEWSERGRCQVLPSILASNFSGF